jgi:hypothetical protein
MGPSDGAAPNREVRILALEIAERETVLAALDDPPAGVEELRGVLLREFEWRWAQGLGSRGDGLLTDDEGK